MKWFGILVLGLYSSAALAQTLPGAPQPNSTAPSATILPPSGRVGQGSAGIAEQPVPGTTTSVNTLNYTVQVSGPYSGSARSTTAMPFNGKLSLADAVKRGLAFNLGAVGIAQTLRQSAGQVKYSRSALLPNVNGAVNETIEKVDLATFGLRFTFPGFHVPTVVGPFNYLQLQASLSQSVANLTAVNNYRSARATARADQYSLDDARNLVTLAVGGAYLQVLAAQARVDAAEIQLKTANAVFQQSSGQHAEGVLGKLNVDQSQVRALTQQQQLITLRNDLVKQKINLARMTGLAPNPDYQLTDTFPFSPAPVETLDAALAQAEKDRPDLKASQAQLEAAQRSLSAARAERLPSASISGDYGLIGVNPGSMRPVYSAMGSINIPLWQGGRISADIEKAQAAVEQRRAELEDTRAQVEADVRQVYLDLEAAAGQVQVARKNVDVAQETLEMTRARMQAGVVNTLEVVQAQETLASAQLDLIDSIFAHNLAKLNLARAMGHASDQISSLLKPQAAK